MKASFSQICKMHNENTLSSILFLLIVIPFLSFSCLDNSSDNTADLEDENNQNETNDESSTENCTITKAESFFPLHLSIWWEFEDDFGNLRKVTLESTRELEGETYYSAFISPTFGTCPFVPPCEEPIGEFRTDSQGVHFYFSESQKGLIYKRNVAEGDIYSGPASDVSVLMAGEEIDSGGHTYSDCNRYYFPLRGTETVSVPFLTNFAYDTICYGWGWIELMGMKLVDTNVDEFIATCEVITE